MCISLYLKIKVMVTKRKFENRNYKREEFNVTVIYMQYEHVFLCTLSVRCAEKSLNTGTNVECYRYVPYQEKNIRSMYCFFKSHVINCHSNNLPKLDLCCSQKTGSQSQLQILLLDLECKWRILGNEWQILYKAFVKIL